MSRKKAQDEVGLKRPLVSTLTLVGLVFAGVLLYWYFTAPLLEWEGTIPASHKMALSFKSSDGGSLEMTVVADDTVYATLAGPKGRILIDDEKVLTGGWSKAAAAAEGGTYTIWLHNINLFATKFVRVKIEKR